MSAFLRNVRQKSVRFSNFLRFAKEIVDFQKVIFEKLEKVRKKLELEQNPF